MRHDGGSRTLDLLGGPGAGRAGGKTSFRLQGDSYCIVPYGNFVFSRGDGARVVPIAEFSFRISLYHLQGRNFQLHPRLSTFCISVKLELVSPRRDPFCRKNGNPFVCLCISLPPEDKFASYVQVLHAFCPDGKAVVKVRDLHFLQFVSVSASDDRDIFFKIDEKPQFLFRRGTPGDKDSISCYRVCRAYFPAADFPACRKNGYCDKHEQ